MLKLVGLTHAPRHEAVVATNDVLVACGAIVEDVQEYSNTVTTYAFEVDRDEVPVLVKALLEAAIALEGHEVDLTTLPADNEGFMRATLQITFASEDGNRRNPNPDMG